MFGVAVLTHFNKVGIKRGTHLGYSYVQLCWDMALIKSIRLIICILKCGTTWIVLLYIWHLKKCLNSYLFLVE